MKFVKLNHLDTLFEEMIEASEASPDSWTTLKNGSKMYSCTTTPYSPALGESLNDSKIEFRGRPTYDS